MAKPTRILKDDNTLYCERRRTDLAVERCQQLQAEELPCLCDNGTQAIAEWKELSGQPGSGRLCTICKEHEIPRTWKGDHCRQCAVARKKKKTAKRSPKKANNPQEDPVEDPDDGEGLYGAELAEHIAGREAGRRGVTRFVHYKHGQIEVAEDTYGNLVVSDGSNALGVQAASIESLWLVLEMITTRRREGKK